MNPMQMIMQIARSGNPMQLIQQMASQNPVFSQAYKLMHGKTTDELKSMAYNMAKEAGTTPEEIARRLGL